MKESVFIDTKEKIVLVSLVTDFAPGCNSSIFWKKGNALSTVSRVYGSLKQGIQGHKK